MLSISQKEMAVPLRLWPARNSRHRHRHHSSREPRARTRPNPRRTSRLTSTVPANLGQRIRGPRSLRPTRSVGGRSWVQHLRAPRQSQPCDPFRAGNRPLEAEVRSESTRAFRATKSTFRSCKTTVETTLSCWTLTGTNGINSSLPTAWLAHSRPRILLEWRKKHHLHIYGGELHSIYTSIYPSSSAIVPSSKGRHATSAGWLSDRGRDDESAASAPPLPAKLWDCDVTRSPARVCRLSVTHPSEFKPDVELCPPSSTWRCDLEQSSCSDCRDFRAPDLHSYHRYCGRCGTLSHIYPREELACPVLLPYLHADVSLT